MSNENNSLQIAPFEDSLQSAMEKAGFRTLQEWIALVNREPDPAFVKPTPDKKAKTLVISAIESTLDAVFLGQWGDSDANVQIFQNEIVCTLRFWAIHPITKNLIERTGVAALQIMVDQYPVDQEGKPLTPKSRTQWSLDLANNKKPNALKMNAPAVKALALKNAVVSLGNIFGRNLNRKERDNPEAFYSEEFEAQDAEKLQKAEIDEVFSIAADLNTEKEVLELAGRYPQYHKGSESTSIEIQKKFRGVISARIKEIQDAAKSGK